MFAWAPLSLALRGAVGRRALLLFVLAALLYGLGQGVVLRNLETNAEQPVSIGEVSGAIDARSGLQDELRTRLLEQDAVPRRWIKPTVEFLGANLEPNLVFSRAETARRVRNAGEQVSTVSRVFRRGQVLIRRGDTVSHGLGTTLRQFNDERSDITKYSTLAGITLLMALMVAGWGKILRRFGGVSGWPRELSMVYLLMILFVALNRLGVFVATSMAVNSAAIWWSADAYLWGLPYAAGPITVFVLLGIYNTDRRNGGGLSKETDEYWTVIE